MKAPPQNHFGIFENLKYRVEHLAPSYFSLVMATGIVSIASWYYDLEKIALGLFYLNIFFTIVLSALFIWRAISYRKQFTADFSDHSKGAGYLTIVAGLNTLGSQGVLIAGMYSLAEILYYFAFVIWFFFIYGFFTDMTVKQVKPSLKEGINGVWLMVIVSTQSIALLGLPLFDRLIFPPHLSLFVSLSMFFTGVFLYFLIITIIFYRLIFFSVEPKYLTAPYWINMGAVAISTLVGAEILHADADWELFAELKIFVKGFTIWLWSIGTWWIPVIVTLGFWRHVLRKFPLKYNVQYWGMVFPLGMYTVATYRLAQSDHLSFLFSLSDPFHYIALAAWLLTFLGLIVKMICGVREPGS